MNSPFLTVFAALLLLLPAGCFKASPTQEEPSEITGQVLGVNDVGERRDFPVQVLVLAVPSANFDSLLRAVDGPKEPTRDLVVATGTVQEEFATYATGYDVSGEEGQYRIPIEESGVHFLCLTGETEVPERDAWRLAGCMRVEVSAGETVEQNLYMQGNRIVAPPR